jgi:acid phosphatase type 7
LRAHAIIRPAIFCLPFLAGGGGCMGNQSGDFSTSKTGDLSHPLAERTAPDEEEVARCGRGEVRTGVAPEIVRSPYVQRLTDTGGRILWTAEPGEPAKVEILHQQGAAGQLASVTETAAMDGADPDGGAIAYQVALDRLDPGTIYCYQLASGERAATEPAGFRSAPSPGIGARVAFVAFGDSGSGGADQQAILEQLGTVPFRLMIHTGDIAYESGTMSEFEDNYFAVYAPFLRSFPAFPTIGNHDSPAVFRQVYDLPWSGPDSWYSFDYGDVHFVSLDTNHIDAEQADWLDADLAASERAWTVVYGHHPAFSSGQHGSSAEFQRRFVPILERHQVDLVLAGHDHDYERTLPQNGVHYIVTGGGGRGTRPVGESDFTAFSEQVLHFVYVEIQGDELLLHAIDATGAEFDQLAIHH